jgi:hypothetical protein
MLLDPCRSYFGPSFSGGVFDEAFIDELPAVLGGGGHVSRDDGLKSFEGVLSHVALEEQETGVVLEG